MLDGTIQNPKPSAETLAIIQKVKAGSRITRVEVIGSGGSNGNVSFFSGNTRLGTIPAKLGNKGMSAIGQGVEGDLKTPRGDFAFISRRRGPSQSPLLTSAGMSLGNAYIETDAKDKNGVHRAIALHGQSLNRPDSSTAGCTALDNDDMVALFPYITTGTPLKIR
jgi:L,D-peptidoglycan transpeptidase YkuD (ErfK/YbiS/YcfS/YnhG family)